MSSLYFGKLYFQSSFPNNGKSDINSNQTDMHTCLATNTHSKWLTHVAESFLGQHGWDGAGFLWRAGGGDDPVLTLVKIQRIPADTPVTNFTALIYRTDRNNWASINFTGQKRQGCTLWIHARHLLFIQVKIHLVILWGIIISLICRNKNKITFRSQTPFTDRLGLLQLCNIAKNV